MVASSPSWNKTRPSVLVPAFLLLGLLGCVQELDVHRVTTSLAVEVMDPPSLGSETDRLPTTLRQATFKVTALDAQGQLDPSFSTDVDVYTQYLGTLTPERGSASTLHVTLTNGVGTGRLNLPPAFGATFLWVEDAAGSGATFATGVSQTLWFRDPYLSDMSRPPDETSLEALASSILEGKQVSVSKSEFGDAGRLVVTAVYPQGYTVSDVDCSQTPCVTPPYGHMYVYTFGRAKATDGTGIEVGQTLASVGGGIGEFNGFTELNFPQSVLADATPNEALLPAPVPLDLCWLDSRTGAGGMINLEKLESALVTIEDGTVKPLDSNYERYGQWKLGFDRVECPPGSEPTTAELSVVTTGQVPGFDPACYVGKKIPRIVGTLQAVNIGSLNVWKIHPRRAEDVTLPAGVDCN